ncbi:hypothetical protein OC861_002790 [Tilletia horrida]|nr:hypothetical protein OC861_002790 [Tilletia horrida]
MGKKGGPEAGAAPEADAAQQHSSGRFHLPIPSVFRPRSSANSKQKEQVQRTRPATIEELANAAAVAEVVFNPAIPIRRFIAGAAGLVTQADTYLDAKPSPDYQQAFICLVKAARLLIDLLPNQHPGWKSDLDAAGRTKVKEDGQAVLDKISKCKPVLIDAFDRWKAQHPDVDIKTIPTALTLPAQHQQLRPPSPSPAQPDLPETKPASEASNRQPTPSSSSSALRSDRSSESFDVRSILGYGPSAATGQPLTSSSSPATSSRTGTVTPKTPSSIPYNAAASSRIEPWSAPPADSAYNNTLPVRFSYPILRRSSTQRTNASSSSKRQGTMDSTTTTSSSVMTPDQSGQGFAPRTALGESYYMTIGPSISSSAFPWSEPQVRPAQVQPPPALPPLVPPHPLPVASASRSSTPTPTTPDSVRSSGVLGPRLPVLPGQGPPPRPIKSNVQPAPLPPPFNPYAPPPPLSSVPIAASTTSSGLSAIEADGGGSRLEQHVTQLFTLSRQAQPPAIPSAELATNPQPLQHAPVPLPTVPEVVKPKPPALPQRSATAEEEMQLAWALEASRKDMEERERKAAAGAGIGYAAAPAAQTTTAPALEQHVDDIGVAAFTEGGSPLRTVILPTRVLSLFLALARENTENNVETCALLMGKLKPAPTNPKELAFHITHLTVPKQSGSSDRCETHDEEAIWAFQEEHDLVTVGWIHTHPTQSAFLSSLDMHSQCSFQALTPETIMHCRAPGLFHPHVSEDGDDIPALYTDALHGHVRLDAEARLMVVDLR